MTGALNRGTLQNRHTEKESVTGQVSLAREHYRAGTVSREM